MWIVTCLISYMAQFQIQIATQDAVWHYKKTHCNVRIDKWTTSPAAAIQLLSLAQHKGQILVPSLLLPMRTLNKMVVIILTDDTNGQEAKQN